MHANIVLLGLVFWFHNAVAQKGLQCFIPGECLDSQILGATPTNDSRECWRQCQSVTGCTWFTFYKDSQVCTPLSGCLRLSNEKCQDNCISGEEECPEVQCRVHGRCYGALEGIRRVANAKECATICKHRQECFWNTYDPEHDSCLMTNDCPLLDRTCSNCSSSERDCVAEIDDNMILDTSIEDNSKGGPSMLFGLDDIKEHYYFDLDSKMTEKCYTPLPTSNTGGNIQYSMVDNDFHSCSEGTKNDFLAILCHHFDNKYKTWVLKDFSKQNNTIFSFLPIPNQGILIFTKSKFVYFYNGLKIEQVSEGSPFANSSLQTSFCRTVISNDEILVGLSHGVEPVLRSVNIKTGAFDNIKLPNVNIRRSVCGAFGPKGQRKVAIFGGKNMESGGAFDRTLILDWNSKAFEADGPSLKDVVTTGRTIDYKDTFLYYCRGMMDTQIYKFDITGVETQIPFLGKIQAPCINLALIQDDVPGCKTPQDNN